MGGDGDRIGCQIEHTPQPRDDGRQSRELGEAHGRAQRVAVGRFDRDGSLQPIQLHRSRITVGAVHAQHPAIARRRRNSIIAVPVVGRMIAQQKNDLAGGAGRKIRSGWRVAIRSAGGRTASESFVEAANAAEAGGERYLGHRQPRLMNKLLGQKNAARLRDGHRRRAEMLAEQTTQLPFAEAKAPGQCIDIGLIQRAVLDQAERARDRVRRAAPRAEIRRRLRPAAQAGAEARLLRRRRRRERRSRSSTAAFAPGKPDGNRRRWF